jgi:hypothetical protein
MEKYLRFAWLIATITAWLSSWNWAEDVDNPGMQALTILWFVISLVLFLVGMRFRKSLG